MADVTGATRWHIVPPLLGSPSPSAVPTNNFEDDRLTRRPPQPSIKWSTNVQVNQMGHYPKQMGHKCTNMEWWMKQVCVWQPTQINWVANTLPLPLSYTLALIKYIYTERLAMFTLVRIIVLLIKQFLPFCTHKIGHKSNCVAYRRANLWKFVPKTWEICWVLWNGAM